MLTTDIIGSTKLKNKQLEVVRDALDNEFESLQKKHKKTRVFFEIYRGDSFQGIVLNVEKALGIAFLLKCAINKINLEKGKDLDELCRDDFNRLFDTRLLSLKLARPSKARKFFSSKKHRCKILNKFAPANRETAT